MNSTTPSPALSEIGQIAITVGDVAKAKVFYGEVLGLKFLFNAGASVPGRRIPRRSPVSSD